MGRKYNGTKLARYLKLNFSFDDNALTRLNFVRPLFFFKFPREHTITLIICHFSGFFFILSYYGDLMQIQEIYGRRGIIFTSINKEQPV